MKSRTINRNIVKSRYLDNRNAARTDCRVPGRFKLNTMALIAALGLGAIVSASGQGMPSESRQTIHKLFDGHKEITRDVRFNSRGYEATTESDNPEVARAIKRHVSQMADRLKSGLMVRRWDPAFEEYVRHYDDIEHVFKPTRKGMKVIVRGRTDEAVKVAKNHTKVLAGFVAEGWGAHHRRHPVALSANAETTASRSAEVEQNCCPVAKATASEGGCKGQKSAAKSGKPGCQSGCGGEPGHGKSTTETNKH